MMYPLVRDLAADTIPVGDLECETLLEAAHAA